MTELATAHPMMGGTSPYEIYHRVFCYWCSEIMGNDYVCWAALQQFKHSPNKRRAIFIVDNWLRDTGGAVEQESLRQSILEPVNTGSKGSRFTVAKRDATLAKVADLKTVKTWTGKLRNWTNRASLGAVQADLLDGMALACEENLTGDVLAKRVMDSEKNMLGSGYYATGLRTDIPTLTAIGFDTKAMGVW